MSKSETSRNEFCQGTRMRVKEKMESGHESSMRGPYRAALKCDACLYAGHTISLETKTVLTETEAHKSTRQSGE